MIARLRQWIGRHPDETVIFCVSFLVHLAVSVFLVRRFGETRVLYFENEDAVGYLELAQNVAAGNGFMYQGVASAVRTPFYPLFLALLMLFPASMPWAVLLVQNVLASLSGVLLYRIGTRLFSRPVGLLAGWAYALEPYMVMTANLATTETVFNFIIILFLDSIIRWYVEEKPGIWRVMLSAGLLGVATLIRPVALYAPATVFFLVLIRMAQTKRVMAEFKRFGVFLAIFLLTLAPWSLRQYSQFGRFRITNIDANMMYFRIAPIVVSAEEGVSYVEALRILKDRLVAVYPAYTDQESYTFAYYDFMNGEAKKIVAKNSLLVAKYYALSLIPGLTGTGYEYMLDTVFGLERTAPRISYTDLLLRGDMRAYGAAVMRMDVFQVALLGGAGVWVTGYLLIFYSFVRKVRWKEDWPAFFVLILLGGYFIFFSLGPQVHTRYRMPTLPFLYLLIAYAVHALFSRKSSSL